MVNPVLIFVQNGLENNSKKQSLFMFTAGAIFLHISVKSTDGLKNTNCPSCPRLEYLHDVCFLCSGSLNSRRQTGSCFYLRSMSSPLTMLVFSRSSFRKTVLAFKQ